MPATLEVALAQENVATQNITLVKEILQEQATTSTHLAAAQTFLEIGRLYATQSPPPADKIADAFHSAVQQCKLALQEHNETPPD